MVVMAMLWPCKSDTSISMHYIGELEVLGANLRSCRSEVFCKKGVLENFTKFTENTCAKVSFLKKRLWHRCFPVNFVKFLRATFFIEHLR